MVMRTIEIKKISFEVDEKKQAEVIKKLKETYGDLDITQEGKKIIVTGNLRNYKKRNKIIYILSEGKHGENI